MDHVVTPHYYQTPQGVNKFIEVCNRKQIHIIEQMIADGVDFNICILKGNKLINLVGIMIRHGIIDILEKINVDYTIHDTKNLTLCDISIRYNFIIPQVYSLTRINRQMINCAFKFRNYKLLNYFIYTADPFEIFELFTAIVDIDNIHVFIECGFVVFLNNINHAYYSSNIDIINTLLDNGYVIRKDISTPIIFHRVDEFLIDYFGIDFVGIEDDTPLFHAIKRHDEAGVRLLLAKGAKIDDDSKELTLRTGVFINLLFDVCPLCREISSFRRIIHFNKNKNHCIICLDERESLYYYECGHVNICDEC